MLNQAKKIFLVGIKGVAMANLALILKKMGKKVSGSDVEEEFITDDLLKKNKIAIEIGFDPGRLAKNTDLLIYSSGHQGQNNPQVLQAKKQNIKTLTQAEFLTELVKQFKTKVAVCGCHGKTTTSSHLSSALLKLGAKPSYMVGSSSFDGYPGGNYDGDNYFVIEADEYGVNPPYDLTPKFQLLNPDYILCTNIDFDHPDVYTNIEQVKKSFFKFFSKIKLNLFFCADDENLMSVAKQLTRKSYLTYGYNQSADLRIINPKSNENGSIFELIYEKKYLGLFRINLFGKKNISNTAGVVLTLLNLGFPAGRIKSAIKDFTGPKRRFEEIYHKSDTYLFDDYAHHPNEIKATISAARSRFPKKRIVIIFQPHTYSRTQALLKDFAKSLSLADISFVLPIFASARENPQDYNISAKDIVKFNTKKLIYSDTKNHLLASLKSTIKNADVIFTMGAGSVYKLSSDIIEIIKSL